MNLCKFLLQGNESGEGNSVVTVQDCGKHDDHKWDAKEDAEDAAVRELATPPQPARTMKCAE